MSTIDTIYQNVRLTTSNGPEGVSEFVLKVINATGSLFAGINQAIVRQRSRRTLLDLTDAELLDVGITRQQALYEAGRPFWS